jgi:hypothetical protein
MGETTGKMPKVVYEDMQKGEAADLNPAAAESGACLWRVGEREALKAIVRERRGQVPWRLG